MHFHICVCSCHGDKSSSCTRGNLYCDIYFVSLCNVSVEVAESFFFGKNISKPVCKNHTIANIVPKERNDIFFGLYLKLRRNELSEIAHHPHDMFKRCSFEGSGGPGACNELMGNRGPKVFTPRMGLCYMFNFGSNHSKDLATENANANSGLTLDIDIEGKYYMRNDLTPSDGILVLIHNKTIPPDLDSRIIRIRPQTSTNLGMSLVTIDLLQDPYVSKCTFDYPAAYNISDFDYEYSEPYCQAECRSLYIIRKCGCWHPYLIPAKLDFDPGSMPWCSLQMDPNVVTCFLQGALVSGEEIGCKCPSPCHDTNYKIQISESHWPSRMYWAKLAENYKVLYKNEKVTSEDGINFELAMSRGIPDSNSTFSQIGPGLKEHIYENYLQLNVFYETMLVETITEYPEYTFLSFLSSIGGDLSLYIGITILSFVEIAEYLARLLISGLSRKMH